MDKIYGKKKEKKMEETTKIKNKNEECFVPFLHFLFPLQFFKNTKFKFFLINDVIWL